MSAEALQVAKVYRQLLRAVKKHVAKEDRARHFKEYVTEEFRNYSKLVHHHQELLFSYNIAVDRSDEMKKVLGKSAASVGLQLPEHKHKILNQIWHNWSHHLHHLHHHGFRNVSRSDIGNYPATCWGLPPLWLWSGVLDLFVADTVGIYSGNYICVICTGRMIKVFWR
ncbi:uncharacterized protein Pyn_11961 [Prunus yedoensis var. nudiflora]|uniref:Complex 1 LYR protein domain-containing protein n=1 Tax=Prunus yedoensis var. nudiflora TaxID=2094558 RepID=A0A314Y5Q4_PRUYE|nr:uncharacterized protein Pyn_11961 [Prunus yedoensis var. nudiflora]